MKTCLINCAKCYSANALILVCLVMFTACTSLLTATFNNDTVGNPPNKSLPGNPNGDQITYKTALEDRLEVVTRPDFATRALAHQYASLPSSVPSQDRWINFRAKSTNLTKPVTFTWSGIADFSSGQPFLIYLEDGSGGIFGIIKIESDGSVMLADDAISDSEAGTIASGQKHTFIVNVDVANEKYNLSVLKSGGNITVENHPLFVDNNLAYANPAHPTASFQFPGGAGSFTYFLDEIFISKGKN